MSSDVGRKAPQIKEKENREEKGLPPSGDLAEEQKDEEHRDTGGTGSERLEQIILLFLFVRAGLSVHEWGCWGHELTRELEVCLKETGGLYLIFLKKTAALCWVCHWASIWHEEMHTFFLYIPSRILNLKMFIVKSSNANEQITGSHFFYVHHERYQVCFTEHMCASDSTDYKRTSISEMS